MFVVSVVIDPCMLEQCKPHSASMDLLCSLKIKNVMKKLSCLYIQVPCRLFCDDVHALGQVSNVDFHSDQFANNRFFVVVLVYTPFNHIAIIK